jgi:hypothetical protein
MKKKCKVVMLQTNEACPENGLFINVEGNPVQAAYYNTMRKQQHLYLISDDEIKESDWVYHIEYGFIAQVKDLDRENDYSKYWNLKRTNHTDGAYAEVKLKKVIASTNSELVIGLKGAGRVKIPSLVMPTFSEDFIKAYVKANGGIDEVNVEYDSQYIGKYTTDGIAWLPKLRDDNTVIISEAKTMYSRDEVAQLIRKYRTYAWKKGLTVNEFDKWIEENL